MKKFIAFINGSNSGVQTRKKAEAWAKDMLAGNGKHNEIQVAEIVSIVRRTKPPVEVIPFKVEPEGSIEGTEASVGPDFKFDNNGAGIGGFLGSKDKTVEHHQV